MQKYFNNIDDYCDDSRSPIIDVVEWPVPRIIAVGGIVLILMLCAYLEAL